MARTQATGREIAIFVLLGVIGGALIPTTTSDEATVETTIEAAAAALPWSTPDQSRDPAQLASRR